MTQKDTPRGLSRRRLMRGAATASATVAAATAMAGAPHLTNAEGVGVAPVTVAATVVRASHDPAAPGTLKVGVRASVVAPGFLADHLVLVVDDVRFGQAPADVGRQISASVRDQIVALLQRRDLTVQADDVAVQVFGGAL